MPSSADTPAWLGRVALSVLLALAVGGLVYVVARASTSVDLIRRQQALFRDITAALEKGDVQQLATADIRARRQELRAVEARYNQISAQAAIAAAGISAVIGYIVLERRASSA